MSIILVSSEMPEVLGMVIDYGDARRRISAELKPRCQSGELMAAAVVNSGKQEQEAAQQTTQTLSRRGVAGKAWWIENKSLVALLVLIGVVSFLSPNFFTADNLLNILRQSVNAIMAVGMTLVILTAGIDLSVGSVLA